MTPRSANNSRKRACECFLDSYPEFVREVDDAISSACEGGRFDCVVAIPRCIPASSVGAFYSAEGYRVTVVQPNSALITWDAP